ncbi:MAG: PEGA domain-containing protein [Candidatus Dojkabacteria bacterium]|jgi:hypothetical protein|nr:PEGA domain-containing protein [Candidatus Dojkabacteria bacterium]
MKSTGYNKRLFTLISILASIFVYTGAVAIYFYANGWRLDPQGEIFIKTGVLTVQSDPSLANIYIEGKQEGRTPKSVSLPVGTYNISAYRSGYVQWEKNIEIKEEKSTPVHPWLIKEKILESNMFSLSQKTYVNSWINESQNYIYFLTKQPLTTGLLYRYELYRFDINTTFWDLGSNPKIVLTLDLPQESEIGLDLSPNGILAVLQITDATSTKSYLLDSTQSSNLASMDELNISALSSYKMSWSLNNQYLMFDSNTDLISYDISRQTRYLLIKKEEDKSYIWSTDEQGYFYKVDENTENQNEDVYAYLLIQQQMDGSNSKVLVDDLYFQKDKGYIDQYKDDSKEGKYAPFTNSPQSTKSVGKLQSIRIHQGAKGIYLRTETSAYWYSMDNQKYYLISPYPSQFVQFSPDNYKLIFKDTQGYNVFTFNKQDGDHTVELGSKNIKGLDTDSTNVNWISNSSYIWYEKDNVLYIADKDGDNQVEILKELDTLKYFVITISSDKVYTFYSENKDTSDDIYIDSYLFR